MTDPIADLLTRIRNALAVGKTSITVPHSSVKHDIANTLLKEGYLAKVKIDKKVKPQPQIIITLQYIGKEPAISKIDRISKPGRRVYQKVKDLKPVLSGHGISILSTSQGIMTNKNARRLGLGGEIICKVW